MDQRTQLRTPPTQPRLRREARSGGGLARVLSSSYQSPAWLSDWRQQHAEKGGLALIAARLGIPDASALACRIVDVQAKST